MKRKLVVFILALVLVVSFVCTQSFALDYFWDTAISGTLPANTTTPGKLCNVAGYREVSMIARFVGPAGTNIYMDIAFNGYTMYEETFVMPSQGWMNLTRKYTVCAPTLGIGLWPTANVTATVQYYAAF